VELVRTMAGEGAPIGVICHGPWLLIDADALKGRTLTCVPQLRADVVNAGAAYRDEVVHVDRDAAPLLVSSRDHNTAPEFAQALVREFAAARA
jgi:protease I